MKIAGRSNYKPGSGKDECGSPPYAVVPLVKWLDFYNENWNGSTDRKSLVLWEPAPGPEAQHLGLVNGLELLGYTVIYTEGDFLSYDSPPCKINGIITNPPYNSTLKRKFMAHCERIALDTGGFWALLTTPSTLHEIRLRSLVEGCSLHVPHGRISFKMPEKGWGTEENPTTPTFNTAWISKWLTRYSNTIAYDDFQMNPNHFVALKRWQYYLKDHR